MIRQKTTRDILVKNTSTWRTRTVFKKLSNLNKWIDREEKEKRTGIYYQKTLVNIRMNSFDSSLEWHQLLAPGVRSSCGLLQTAEAPHMLHPPGRPTMPMGVSWPTYLKMFTVSLLAMCTGPGVVHRFYRFYLTIPEIPPKHGELKTKLLGLKEQTPKPQQQRLQHMTMPRVPWISHVFLTYWIWLFVLKHLIQCLLQEEGIQGRFTNMVKFVMVSPISPKNAKVHTPSFLNVIWKILNIMWNRVFLLSPAIIILVYFWVKLTII